MRVFGHWTTAFKDDRSSLPDWAVALARYLYTGWLMCVLVASAWAGDAVASNSDVRIVRVSPSVVRVGAQSSVEVLIQVLNSRVVAPSMVIEEIDFRGKRRGVRSKPRKVAAGLLAASLPIMEREPRSLWFRVAYSVVRGGRRASDAFGVTVARTIDSGTTEVGAAGGTVTTTSGISLSIPAGALTQPVEISINAVGQDELPRTVPDNYELIAGVNVNPPVTQFRVPATLFLPAPSGSAPGQLFPILTYDLAAGDYAVFGEGQVTEDGGFVAIELPHLSQYYLVGPSFALRLIQQSLKDNVLAQLDRFMNKYRGQCFFDRSVLTLGDPNKAREVILRGDISIIVSDLLIDTIGTPGAEALYIPIIFPTPFGRILLHRTIILRDQPENLNPSSSTLWHEVMHAIFDLHVREVRDVGIVDDEAIPEYMDFVVDTGGLIDNFLIPVDAEFTKARSGIAFNAELITRNLSSFNTLAAGFLEERRITRQMVELTRGLTGFDVEPTFIMENYEASCEPFDYTLSNSGNISVTQGFSGSNTITRTLLSGISTPISLSVFGLPQGASAVFTNNPCDPTCSSTLTISTSESTPTGTFPITVTGTPLDKATTFDLVITAPLSQCSDGLDNDGDGLIDFPNDPGCSSPADNDETNNNPPTIISLTANPSSVFFSVPPCGDLSDRQSLISVAASDPDGDALTYSWSATTGELSETTGPEDKTWTAPLGIPFSSATITVTVTDALGASTSTSIIIQFGTIPCFIEI